jgi:hypothetical protein
MYPHQYYEQVCDSAKNHKVKCRAINAAIRHLSSVPHLPNWFGEHKRLFKKQIEIWETEKQKVKKPRVVNAFIDDDINAIKF